MTFRLFEVHFAQKTLEVLGAHHARRQDRAISGGRKIKAARSIRMKREYPERPLIGVGAVIVDDDRVLADSPRPAAHCLASGRCPAACSNAAKPCARRRFARRARKPD